MQLKTRAVWVFAIALGASAALAADAEIDGPIAALKAVDREGKNNDAVGFAWKSLVGKGSAALFPALEAIDDAKPTASNWLFLAVTAIAEAEVQAKRPLPADKLEAFAKNLKYAPSARRLVYELLVAQDKTAAERLLPGFLNDPQPDLRRDAVAAELGKLEMSARASVKDDLMKLLGSARDKDQVEAIAKKLEVDYKTKVSLTEQFGFIAHWDIAGPFESTKGKALTLKHRPEEKVEIAEKMKGKGGAEVQWKPLITRDKYGVVDFNKEIDALHDTAGYAATVVFAEKPTAAEIRATTPNAIQIFLNGKKLFEREEYHHGSNMDHHVAKGALNAGANLLVVKVCQNNQKEIWAQKWEFQARICDGTGAPLPGVTQVVRNGKDVKQVKLGSIPALTDNVEEKK